MNTVPEAGPVAVVSGGSRGIGRAIVERLAADGYHVAFCYHRDDDAAAETAAAAGRHAPEAVTGHRVDIRDRAEVTAFVDALIDRYGHIDCLVPNAGVTSDAPLMSLGPTEWSTVIDTNLTGTYNLCQPVVFHMLRRRRGTITTISSVAGVYGNPGQTNYAASKAGIIGFSRSLAKEVGRRGIRVNTVVPGFIDTAMTETVDSTVHDDIALRRMGTADEVATAVSFLASDKASYITGSVLHVDGGIRL